MMDAPDRHNGQTNGRVRCVCQGRARACGYEEAHTLLSLDMSRSCWLFLKLWHPIYCLVIVRITQYLICTDESETLYDVSIVASIMMLSIIWRCCLIPLLSQTLQQHKVQQTCLAHRKWGKKVASIEIYVDDYKILTTFNNLL